MNKIKLSDVAIAAEVSKSTVSQYLSGRYNYMSKDTKLRIEKAIEELNYVPNSVARSLKTLKTMTVGVIVRDITGSYTSLAVRGMDDFCKKKGYNLIICNSDFDASTEAKAIKSLKQLCVDGIIIASSGQNNALISETEKQKTPVIQFQLERDDNADNIIVSDYRQAAFEATEYLIRLGHRRIGFITQKFENVKSRKERFQGYTDALDSHDIPISEDLIMYWHRDTGFQVSPVAMLSTPNPPTVFFTQHLAITTDLLVALAEANIRVYEDVSLLGFDEIPMTEFFKTPITVIKQQPYEVGTEAAKLLINHLENPDWQNQRIKIPCFLIERDSCKDLTKA